MGNLKQPDFHKDASESLSSSSKLQHPLKGFIHTDDGFALTPTFTSKKIKQSDNTTTRKRYRYYVSQQAIGQGYKSSKIKTVNALIIEKTVQEMIVQTLPNFADSINLEDYTLEEIEQKLRGHAQYLSSCEVHESGFIGMIQHLAPKIILGVNSIEIQIKTKSLKALMLFTHEQIDNDRQLVGEKLNIHSEVKNDLVTLKAKVNLKFTRGRTELVDSETGKVVTPNQRESNKTLIQVIVQAEFWRQQMIENPTRSLAEIMKPYKVKPNYVRRLINAAYLAPEIKRAIFKGTQPSGLQAQDIIQKHSMDWQAQKEDLGFV